MKRNCSLAIMALIAVMQISCSTLVLQGRVAQIFGKDIFMSDLNPNDDELKIVKQSYPNLSDEEALTKARSEKLSSLIWTPIMAEFAKTHDVEPTEEEIQGLAKSMKAMKADLPAEVAKNTPQISAEMERQIYQPFVKNWKISKALHGEYGGTVIFQQANPLEPVGAYRKLLESHEAKGDFEIYDEKLKQQFWEYYVREHPFQVPQNLIDYSQPWWLQIPTSDAAK
jgi:hypothetical protein